MSAPAQGSSSFSKMFPDRLLGTSATSLEVAMNRSDLLDQHVKRLAAKITNLNGQIAQYQGQIAQCQQNLTQAQTLLQVKNNIINHQAQVISDLNGQLAHVLNHNSQLQQHILQLQNPRRG